MSNSVLLERHDKAIIIRQVHSGGIALGRTNVEDEQRVLSAPPLAGLPDRPDLFVGPGFSQDPDGGDVFCCRSHAPLARSARCRS